MSLINKYYKLSSFEKSILLSALFTSLKVRFYIKFFKMPSYVKYLGKKGIKTISSNNNEEKVLIIIKNVKRISKYSFWRTKCFEEAFTTKLLLKKQNINSTIYFGVKKNNNNLDAHSWLKIGDKCIIGCRRIDKYTVTEFFT